MPFCPHSENGNARCNDCDRRYQKEYRSRPDVQERERARRQTAKRKKAQQLRSRKSWVKKGYGLEWEDYQALKVQQNFECAICGTVFDGEPDVDHNHETGEVRALLCHQCNIGIGNFKEDPVLLQAAIDYLDKFDPHTRRLNELGSAY